MKEVVLAVCWSGAGVQVCVSTIPKRKDVSNHPRGTAVAVHQSEKGYKVMFIQFGAHHFKVRKMISKWFKSNVAEFLFLFLISSEKTRDVLRTGKTKVNIMPASKHGRGVLIWACLKSTRLRDIESENEPR